MVGMVLCAMAFDSMDVLMYLARKAPAAIDWSEKYQNTLEYTKKHQSTV